MNIRGKRSNEDLGNSSNNSTVNNAKRKQNKNAGKTQVAMLTSNQNKISDSNPCTANEGKTIDSKLVESPKTNVRKSPVRRVILKGKRRKSSDVNDKQIKPIIIADAEEIYPIPSDKMSSEVKSLRESRASNIICNSQESQEIDKIIGDDIQVSINVSDDEFLEEEESDAEGEVFDDNETVNPSKAMDNHSVMSSENEITLNFKEIRQAQAKQPNADLMQMVYDLVDARMKQSDQ